jgi:hypothetical protein
MPYRTRRERRYRRKMAKAVAQGPECAGGWGKDSPISRSDWLLVRRAIREGWDTPPAVRVEVAARCIEAAESGDHRMLLSAASAFLAMQQDDLRRTLARIDAELAATAS